VMFGIGERVGSGALPWWLGVFGLEMVAVVGTAALFFVCRGPGHALVERLGRRIGLTADRLGRASAFVERRGRPALAIGRSTPGLRTVTVVAAGSSGLHPRRALPALIVGSSVFLQLHLVLGVLFGPLARRAFEHAKVAALVALVVLVVAAGAFWLVRRGRQAGTQAWTEAACPACLGLALVADHLPQVAGMSRMGRARAG
jgi:membrane protein DedA with SNARE-associated domain